MAAKVSKVLICGGGIGGLTLAQALRQNATPFEVFERDADDSSRPQGWAITLHRIVNDLQASLPTDLPPIESVSALYETGLPVEAKIYDLHTMKVLETLPKAGGTAMLCANRAKLRAWLRTNLNIRWGKSLERFEQDPNGVTAYFADGTSARGDILVGADGTGSHVRRQLCDSDAPQPDYVGIPALWGLVSLSGETLQRQLQLASAFYFAVSSGLRMFVGTRAIHPGGTGDYYWLLNWAEADAERDDFWVWHASQDERLAFALEKLQDAPAPLREIVEATKAEDLVDPPIRIRDMLPFELPRGRVTLLGDAIHPMTPFRGEGGNHAMQDAVYLARSIAKTTRGADIIEMLKGYEKEMIERGSEAVLGSRAIGMDVAGALVQKYAPWSSKAPTKSTMDNE